MAAERPVPPEAISCLSIRTTFSTPRLARLKAVAAPLMPAPMTTAPAVFGNGFMISNLENRGGFRNDSGAPAWRRGLHLAIITAAAPVGALDGRGGPRVAAIQPASSRRTSRSLAGTGPAGRVAPKGCAGPQGDPPASRRIPLNPAEKAGKGSWRHQFVSARPARAA